MVALVENLATASEIAGEHEATMLVAHAKQAIVQSSQPSQKAMPEIQATHALQQVLEASALSLTDTFDTADFLKLVKLWGVVLSISGA